MMLVLSAEAVPPFGKSEDQHTGLGPVRPRVEKQQAPPLIQNFQLGLLSEEIWHSFCGGNLGDVVVECREGTELPLVFKLNSDLFTMEGVPQKKITLRVDKTFYIRHVAGAFLFSWDEVSWCGFSNFFKGTSDIDFNIDHNGPEVSVEFLLVP